MAVQTTGQQYDDDAPPALKPYTVIISGIEHTMMLDEDSAATLYGDAATPAGESTSTSVAHKARRPKQ